MIKYFLANWFGKGALILIGVLLVSAGGLYYLYDDAKDDLATLQTKYETLKKDYEKLKATADQCEKDKSITEENTSDYQTRLSSVNKQLSNLKRLRSNPRCIPITR